MTKRGHTALICAALGGDDRSVEYLLRPKVEMMRRDSSGINALERHIDNWVTYNRRLILLLFAAGDQVSGPYVVWKDKPVKTAVPDFLQELNTPQHSLKDTCRRVIRKHLVDVCPINLFIQMPKLELSCMVREYLLYIRIVK